MEDLIKKIYDLSGPTLFRDAGGLIEACKDFLVGNGYRIYDPLREYKNIKKLDDLIDFFYSSLLINHQELNISYRSTVKDRQIAKLFIKSRMAVSNISRAQAISECVTIIRIVIKYEEEFHFNRLPDFTVFGQDSYGWVTQKAIDIMSKEKNTEKEKWRFEFVTEAEEEAYKKLGGPAFTDEDLDNILKDLEEN